tara:strand:+ start:1111 stop:1311 length:201 start_codon:yes stop_codon:yes gene_type:complete
MSKGSRQRPTNTKTFNEGWDRIFNKSEDKMSKENIFVRVYKDVEVKNNDDYIENAIAIATDFLWRF